MAEFNRVIRYHKYGSKDCKKYLRLDFDFKCAYCYTNEAEVITGIKSFQIDHFKPKEKFKENHDIHDYNNLYYSCEVCNSSSGKGDSWDDELLDPCKDEIFGFDKHIFIGENYKLIYNSPKGKKYIETLKLNNKIQRRIREARDRYRKKLNRRQMEISSILIELNNIPNSVIDTEEIKKIRSSLEINGKEWLGPYFDNLENDYFDEEYERQFETIISDYFNLNKSYFNYDLDYELINENYNAKGYLRVIDNMKNGEKEIRIPLKQAIDWKDFVEEDIVVFIFNRTNRDIFFKKVKPLLTQENLMQYSNYYVIKFCADDELSSVNFKELVTI